MKSLTTRVRKRLLLFCCTLLFVAVSIVLQQSKSFGEVGSGKIVAALENFDVTTDGFKFENYGGDAKRANLTATEMQRMFGNQVCATEAKDADCILTPPAEAWMEAQNASMNAGHCEGMAVLSVLLYSNQIKASDFGSNSASALEIDGNSALQREIAYWFATQATQPTVNQALKAAPNEIVDRLVQSFKTKSDTYYTLGIYKRGNPADGHALTPYGIEDLGDNKVAILSYDNNHPGVVRKVLVDRAKNTWEYSAATNPSEPESLYEGDAETKTLELTPTPPRTEQQVCPFCTDEPTTGLKSGETQPKLSTYSELWIDGLQNPIVVDSQGRRLGYVNNNLVKEIPGAEIHLIRGNELWNANEPPVFYIPRGVAFSVILDGKELRQATPVTVDVISPGYDLSVEEFELNPGQQDVVSIAADGKQISYKTSATESPTMTIGFTTRLDADYEFDFKGVDLDGGGTINVKLDRVQEEVSLNTTGTQKPGNYAIVMGRLDEKGQQIFYHDNIPLNPNDTAFLRYGKWTGEGGAVPLEIDRGSKGSIDETLQLTDDKQ